MSFADMDFSTAVANSKNYNPHHHHHHHHHLHSGGLGGGGGGGGVGGGGHTSPHSNGGVGVKAEESAPMQASPLTGFGVSAAGVNLSVNIGVNITGVPESAGAPWATAAYTSRLLFILTNDLIQSYSILFNLIQSYQFSSILTE